MGPRSHRRPKWDARELIGRFLLLDDDRSYAERIAPVLREVRPVDFARTIAEADDLLAGPFPHIALILDAALPDGDGFAYLDSLRERGLEAPALILTAASALTPIVLVQADRLGARLLQKDLEQICADEFRLLLHRLRDAALDYEERTLGPRAALFDLSDGRLTLAELQVAELRLAGYTNGEAAEELGLALKTVKNQFSNVLAKCGVRGGIASLRDRLARRAKALRRRPRS